MSERNWLYRTITIALCNHPCYTPGLTLISFFRKQLSLRIASVAFLSVAACAQQISPSLYQDMQWRMIGPFRGGRTITAAGVPGEPDTWYFGAVAGGIWKTTNDGNTWSPIFDGQSVASIGALAIAPSAPNVIYAGTGEADMRSDISIGNGVYKSMDAGKTWRHIGLPDTQQIGRIIVDPKNPNIVLVAALGHAYGPNEERGVFRSTDGGETWNKSLFTNNNTGAIDLIADPENFQVLYAALWNVHRTPWSQYKPVSGPGGGIYKSADGGVTWTQLVSGGLPNGDYGRIGIATAPHGRVYALIDTKDPKQAGLYRSDDAGKSWQLVGSDPRITERAWYFSGITVDPSNSEIVFLPNVALYRSSDGGKTFTAVKGAPGGDDYHFLWIDPANSKRMILASDQGAAISLDRGETWSSWYNQPTAQIYRVVTGNQFPYHVYGAQQDSGSVETTSRSDYGSITYRDWRPTAAGESGYIAPDPGDANIVYGGDAYGPVFRLDKRTGQAQDISPSIAQDFSLPLNQWNLRFTWTSPLVFSPFDSGTLYFGSQYVLKTTDHGVNWKRISNDLSGAQKPYSATGPVAAANAEQSGYGVVYTIAPSKVARGQIWTGSDTGKIYLTRDDGKTWSDVSPPNLPRMSRVSMIDASQFDAGTAYAAVDRHRLDDYAPYIFRTQDFGRTWTKITAGIAAPAYARVVREDTERKGLLYAGTETGAYISFDNGDHWQPLQLNLPVVPVYDLAVKDNDLVAATHGRSFWILDDLAPLRQISAEIAGANAYLFRPQTAIRFRNINRDTPLPVEVPAGQNPPAGAILDYYIGSEPPSDVSLDIFDSGSKLIRHFSSADRYQLPKSPQAFSDDWFRPTQLLSKTKGMHRFEWNLRHADPPAIDPQYSSAVAFGQNTPPVAPGPMVLPGEYNVRLTILGREYTESLSVKADPRVKTSQSDLARQFDLENQIVREMEHTSQAFEDGKKIRDQLRVQRANVAKFPGLSALASVIDEKSMLLLEGPAPDPGQDESRAKVPTLKSLNGKLATELGVVDSADGAPTQSAVQAFNSARGECEMVLAGWEHLLENEVASFNRVVKNKDAPQLILKVPPAR